MAVFDYALPDLKKYQGLNPKPEDFDEYWDKALQEMQDLDPRVEIKPAAFQIKGIKCNDLYFSATGGSRVYARYLQPPAGSKPQPAICFFHGYGGHSGDWSRYLHYALYGFHVFALDVRGQAGLSHDTRPVRGNTLHGHIVRGLQASPEDLFYRHVFLDTALLVKIAMAQDNVDSGKIYASGGSQGGGLTLACAALAPAVKKIAYKFPFLADYKRVWELDLCENAYKELKDFFRYADPRQEKRDDIFNKLGYIDIQHLAVRVKAEVLHGIGLADTICPPSTQFAVYNKITSVKQMRIYPEYGHEELPGFNDETFSFFT
ncbi:MAG TPA: alpha/beta fold hydrolase [Spirochaetota bacterium]|nr:alpha/beta fold hydrolase [Spirochaetota bacterium]